MTVIDALGLGLFAVSGTAKALAYGSSGMTAVFLGMFTALAGGLIRDIFIGDVPMLIRDKHLYAVPSFIGCILTVLVWRGVSYGWFDMRSEMLLDVLIVIIVVALRLLSVGFNVTLPGAVERHRVFLPSEGRYLERPVIHPHADTGDTPNTKDEEDKPQDGSRPPQG